MEDNIECNCEGIDPESGEVIHAPYEDVDLHRYQCTACKRIYYYSLRAKVAWETGVADEGINCFPPYPTPINSNGDTSWASDRHNRKIEAMAKPSGMGVASFLSAANIDPYKEVAAYTEPKDVTPLQRKVAKSASFGIRYGVGPDPETIDKVRKHMETELNKAPKVPTTPTVPMTDAELYFSTRRKKEFYEHDMFLWNEHATRHDSLADILEYQLEHGEESLRADIVAQVQERIDRHRREATGWRGLVRQVFGP